jgi:hypothetical protein
MAVLVNPGMCATVVSGVVADPPLAHPPVTRQAVPGDAAVQGRGLVVVSKHLRYEVLRRGNHELPCNWMKGARV